MKQKTKQKTNYTSQIITALLDENQITFKEKKKLDLEDEMKILILKFICLEGDDKLSIVNLFLNNYPKILIDSALQFIKNLSLLSLNELLPSYEPENYSKIKEIKYFKIYLNLTKKKLIPFFLLVGFYSYLNKRKNNIEEIISFQSKDYFEKNNNLYINLKNISLAQLINHYVKYILPQSQSQSQTEVLHEEEKYDDSKLSNTEFKLTFNSYFIYNDLYVKDDLYALNNSIFSALTKHFNSIYLKDSNEYQIVNMLIDSLFEKIYKTIKSGFYEDKEIKVLIGVLYDTIKEYLSFSSQINYISFVDAYSTEFTEDSKDLQLSMVCNFFRGLNPNNFQETFNKIDFGKEKEYFKNIEKYYNQIVNKNDIKEKIAPSGKIINNNIKEEGFIASINTIKEKIENSNYEKFEEIDEEKENQTNDLKDNDINTTNEEEKSNNDNNIPNLIENNDDTNKVYDIEKNELNNIKNNEINKDNSLETLMDRISKLESELKLCKENNTNQKKYFDNYINQSEKKFKESEKKFAASDTKLKETEKKLNESEKKFNEFKNQTSSNNLNLINKIKEQNIKIDELKGEIKLIKLRDISKIIINKYINKYEKEVSKYINKKDKVFQICKLLIGKEKIYFNKIVEKYYHSNNESHFTGLLDEYNNNYFDKNSDITQNIIKDYLLRVFGIEQNEDYKNVKDYLVKLFDLKSVVRFLYKKKKNF